ncbi:MAG: 3-isopropylmalate dehydratase small subunit [Gammaproteobacteria bacterium]|nr:3-isopropylmalate dehydratase small subunit [Gammaproteobacteria bacterium]
MTGSPPIRVVRGTALFIAGDDVDTDQIMPSRFLRSTSFTGLEQHVFEDLRQAGPHPFDDPLHASASILIAERNFGCGSSREHAPQGLARWGIRAIIAESFGEIFAANCTAIGLVCVTLARADRQSLSKACVDVPDAPLCIDLRRQRVEAAGAGFACTLPEGRRQQFLDGSWDSLSLLMADPAAVEEVDARTRVFAPPPGVL